MIKVNLDFWEVHVPNYLKARNTDASDDIRDFLKQTITSDIKCILPYDRPTTYFEIFFEDARQELLFKLKYTEYTYATDCK